MENGCASRYRWEATHDLRREVGRWIQFGLHSELCHQGPVRFELGLCIAILGEELLQFPGRVKIEILIEVAAVELQPACHRSPPRSRSSLSILRPLTTRILSVVIGSLSTCLISSYE